MKKPVILIVDDTPSARETVRAHLQNEPYELLFAASAIEAIRIAETHAIDTVLLDVMMPDMTGYELCETWRREERMRHTPILLISALDGKQHIVRGLDAGADDFLTKPFNGLELRARVRTMLRLKRQYDELKALLRMREEVAMMLVHDMRSPLMAIATHCALLERLGTEPAVQRSTGVVRHQSERLKAFLDQLLVVAKMEHGSFAIHRVPSDVHAIVERLVEAFPVTLQQSDERCEVAIDPALFERVIENLISNAVKFSPEGSRVEVRVDTSDGLVIEVEDNGPGIPAADRDRIFEKFATSKSLKSTAQIGLGLAFCRAVVEAHGGEITVRDAQPHGAIFTIAIPARARARAAA